MPIHDLGYRPWDGPLIAERSRWFVIAETGIRRVWQSAWVKRIVFFAWLPLLLFALGFLIFEWAAHGNTFVQPIAMGLMGMFGEPPNMPDDFSAGNMLSLQTMIQDNRHWFWSEMLYRYLRYPQGFMLVLLVGLIAPRLISEDVSTRAFLFYFSRPLSRFEYVLGKSATVWFFLLLIITAPALFMYVIAVALSASPAVIFDTWDILLQIVLGSFAVIMVCTSVSLCFSSLTRDSRYAGFAWFAMWIVGTVAMIFVSLWRRTQPGFDSERFYVEHYLSPYSVFGAFQQWIFDMQSTGEVLMFILLLVVVFVVSTVVLFYRVSAPMRA